MTLQYKDKKYFYCSYCKNNYPIEKLGKVAGRHRPNRCIDCIKRSDAGKKARIEELKAMGFKVI